MKKNTVTTISFDDNGVVQQGITAHIPFREKIKEGFTMVLHNKAAQDRLFNDPDITAEAHKVFNYIIFNLDYENKIIIHQSLVARQLRITPNTICKILKKFVEKEILHRQDIGRSVIYTLDNSIAWRGSASNLKHARKHQQEDAVNAIQN